MSILVTDAPLEAQNERYPELAATVGGLVARWIWAPPGAYWEVPIPHFAELQGNGPAYQPLRRAPKNPQLGEHYGLDADDRIVAARSYRGDGVLTYEKLIVRTASAVSAVTFDHHPWDEDEPPKTVAATVTIMNDGLALKHISVNVDRERATYIPQWVADTLACVVVTTSSSDGTECFEERYVYRYDDDGELLLIRREHDAEIIYRRPPADLKRTLDQIEHGLTAAIVDVVAAHRPEVPVAVVGLGFDGATILPPSVGIQTERALADKSKTAFERWNPGDMAIFIPEFDLGPELAEAIVAVRRHVEDTEDERLFRAIRRRLARALNNRNWDGELQVAQDFVVVAVDVDADDLPSDVAAGLPRSIRKALRARELI